MKKKEIVFSHIEKISLENPEFEGITTSTLSEHLSMQRSNLSALLNELVKENRLKKTDTRPVRYLLAKDQNRKVSHPSFSVLAGSDSVLQPLIERVCAELAYSGRNTDILLAGVDGSGKSRFCQAIYQYAVRTGILPEHGQLIKLNVKYFRTHENELRKHLTPGSDLLRKAENGLLYLDHVHLLPESARSCIYDLETYHANHGSFILVISADVSEEEDLQKYWLDNTNLQLYFPTLQTWPFSDRIQLIYSILQKQAEKRKLSFILEAETLQSLVLSAEDLTLPKLASEIEKACANAFVRDGKKKDPEYFLYIQDFPRRLRKGIIEGSHKV